MLRFEFPHLQVDFSQREVAQQQDEPAPTCLGDFLADLDDVGLGDVEPPASQPGDGPRAAPHAAAYVPSEVLLLAVAHLSLRDLAAAAAVCKEWREAVWSADDIWASTRTRLLGEGWHAEPHKGARIVQLAAATHTSGVLWLKSTLATTQVAARFMCLRKGYEFLLQACHALWQAVASSAAAVAAGATPSGSSRPPAAKLTHVDQLWEASTSAHGLQVDDKYRPLAVKNLVGKLANSDWRLLYEGYAAAVTLRADEIADQLQRSWRERSRQQQQQERGATAPGGGGGSLHTGAAGPQQPAAGGSPALGAAGGSDSQTMQAMVPDMGSLAGALLRSIERYGEDIGSGWLSLGDEQDLLQAAEGTGSRPAAGIDTWRQLLAQWAIYHRWLELVVARCGPLGARVDAARQLLGPGSLRAGSAASSIPHLLNKGLLVFRSQVLLGSRLRRPLQQAALWLAARAAATEAQGWHAAGGSGLSDADLDTLVRLRKVLQELDVYDDATQPPSQHTLAKFRRCYGALLRRDARAERLGLRER